MEDGEGEEGKDACSAEDDADGAERAARLARLLEQTTIDEAELTADERATFRRLLADLVAHYGCGAVDLKELIALCASLGRELSEEQARETLHQLDADNSGQISYDEFLVWWAEGLSFAALPTLQVKVFVVRSRLA